LVGLAVSLASMQASAQSNPSWWNLASPDATALVGIQWENLRTSVFAEAIGTELSSSGSLGFPDLPCIAGAKQFLISSPALLAIASGAFPPATLREQAANKGMKPASYRGIDLWISPGKATLSVAQWSDGLLLIGMRKTLEAAIDRNLPEGDSSDEGRAAAMRKLYSPLLSRGARIAGGRDLWVVANQFPDPLASLFVPIDADARSFEGAASVHDGLDLAGKLEAESPQAAAETAQTIEQSIPDLPAVVRGIDVKVAGDTVTFALRVDRDELAASLRQAEPPPPAQPTPRTEPVAAIAPAAKPEPPQPSQPQVVHIFGLDGGTREIVLPPAGER
jgi:hypothetical protein